MKSGFLPEHLSPLVSRILDWRWNASAVRRQSRHTPPSGKTPTFSVVIPNYRRGHLIHRPLCHLLNHPAVGEIVIYDDASPPEDFHKLNEFIGTLHQKNKIRIFRREVNCGAQCTKLDAVEAARSEWVLVLDSDNTAFPSFLNRLSRIKAKNPNVFYCSPNAFPYFSFKPFAGSRLDFQTCVEATRSGLLRSVFIINDGNYLVHRNVYLKTFSKLRDLKSDVADVFLANYLFLSGGGALDVLDDGSYHHRVDASSFWMRTAEASRSRVVELFDRLENGLRWDSKLEEILMKS